MKLINNPKVFTFSNSDYIDYEYFFNNTKFFQNHAVSFLNAKNSCVDIDSFFQPEIHRYFMISGRFKVQPKLHNGVLPLYISCKAHKADSVRFGLFFYDKFGEKIKSNVLKCNQNYFLEVPLTAEDLSFSIRLQGTDRINFYGIVFGFYDECSTDIFDLPDGYKCRIKIENKDKAKNGVIVFLPAGFRLKKLGVINFPLYFRSNWSSDLSNYCVVSIADPLIKYKLNCVLSSFFIRQNGESWLEQIAIYLKKIFNDDCRFLLYGSSMGGYAAILLSFYLNADYCIAECPISNLEKSGYFRDRLSSIDVKNNVYLHISEFINTHYQSNKTKMYIHFFAGDCELKNFMEEFTSVDKVINESMKINIEIENSQYGHVPLKKEDAINKINSFLNNYQNFSLSRCNEELNTFTKHIIFGIRFSLLCKTDAWHISANDEFEEYKEKLFAESRLEERFFLFENITLKSLDNIYKHLDNDVCMVVYILTSDSLPKKYKDKLTVIQNQYKFIRVKYYEENCVFGKILRDFFTDYYNESIHVGDMYACARLDDDDALSIDWYTKILSYFNPLFANHCISLHSGYQLFFNSFGKIELRKMELARFIAIGLCVLGRKMSENDEPNNIYYCGPHTLVDTRKPGIVDGSKPYVIRTIANNNDTYVNYDKKIILKNDFFDSDEIISILKEFGISPELKYDYK